MGILRSETMCSGTLVLPVDRARYFVDLIGRSVNLEFSDMHEAKVAPSRPYKRYVWRIEEMERILRFLCEQLKHHDVELKSGHFTGFLEYDHYYKLEPVETELKRIFQSCTEFKENNAGLLLAHNEAIEERYVVEYAARHFWTRTTSPAPTRFGEPSMDGELLADDRGGSVFSHIAGVLLMHDQERFSRFLFRSTRGNTFTHFEQISVGIVDPVTEKESQKSVCVIYYQDARHTQGGSAMHNRIMRACKQFGVNVYPWVTSQEEALQRLRSLGQQLVEKERALAGYERFAEETRTRLLETQLSGNSLIEDWRLFCLKEKSIYTTLNYFDGDSTVRCDTWYPLAEEETIKRLLAQNSTGGGHMVASAMLLTDRFNRDAAPTYFLTNDFVKPTQDLIHTYGVPRYQELTPVFLSTVTFPFIFGVMFGDVGHGLLLLIAGIYLIFNADHLRHEQPAIHQIRYMIFMMGFFATYAGLVYNDFFSTPLNLFGSRYAEAADGQEMEPLFDPYNGAQVSQVSPKYSGPYPFGIDPAWALSSNSLLFLNSFKMKFSVIFGVFQMTVGLILRGMNAIYERSFIDIVGEFLPMLIFLQCFFSYMDYMIMYKWVTHLPDPPGAPSIINNMIAMAMFDDLPTVIVDPTTKATAEVALFPGEKQCQSRLMTYSIMMVPLICLVKPCWITWKQTRRRSRNYDRLGMDSDRDPQAKTSRVDLGELWIHQIIEAIEFVLGTVSHTASYLRLWALSLAHQQLSLVFFQMTLASSLQGAFPWNTISIFFAFAIWFAITVMVLMGMDSLECFLHTLRLHWVEFQSKFYRGDGFAFKPYNHLDTLQVQD